jgi:hypothetical protein
VVLCKTYEAFNGELKKCAIFLYIINLRDGLLEFIVVMGVYAV